VKQKQQQHLPLPLKRINNMMSLLRRYLISGLLVWLPIWVTLLVFKFLVDIMSETMSMLPRRYQPDAIIGFHVPGIGVLITLLLIFFTGALAANFLGKRFIDMCDAVLGRIPLVRTVYNATKQVSETLFTPGGQSFRKVLLVQYPREGLWSLAFQTGDSTPAVNTVLNEHEMISLFIPTTPNPTSGFLMMTPKKDVIEMDMSVEQALKFVISLGVVQPDVKVLVSRVSQS
jgi:uncharacterized membrane protein